MSVASLFIMVSPHPTHKARSESMAAVDIETVGCLHYSRVASFCFNQVWIKLQHLVRNTFGARLKMSRQTFLTGNKMTARQDSGTIRYPKQNRVAAYYTWLRDRCQQKNRGLLLFSPGSNILGIPKFNNIWQASTTPYVVHS